MFKVQKSSKEGDKGMLIAILILTVLSFLNTFLILVILTSMHEKVNAMAKITLICSKFARGFMNELAKKRKD